MYILFEDKIGPGIIMEKIWMKNKCLQKNFVWLLIPTLKKSEWKLLIWKPEKRQMWHNEGIILSMKVYYLELIVWA